MNETKIFVNPYTKAANGLVTVRIDIESTVAEMDSKVHAAVVALQHILDAS